MSLQRAFSQFDRRMNGSLDSQELISCIKTLQLSSVTEEDVKKYILQNPDGCCAGDQFLYRSFIRDIISSYKETRFGVDDTSTLCPYCRRKM